MLFSVYGSQPVHRRLHRPRRQARRRARQPGESQLAATPGGSVETGPIKIGGGFALTGDESALDLPAANGAKLAAKEINAADGVLGRQIDLIVHDSQYKMDVTSQIAKQFVEEDKVIGVIGFTDTDSVLAAGPTIQKAGLPFITAGRDLAQDSDPGRRYDVPGLLWRQRAGSGGR